MESSGRLRVIRFTSTVQGTDGGAGNMFNRTPNFRGGGGGGAGVAATGVADTSPTGHY